MVYSLFEFAGFFSLAGEIHWHPLRGFITAFTLTSAEKWSRVVLPQFPGRSLRGFIHAALILSLVASACNLPFLPFQTITPIQSEPNSPESTPTPIPIEAQLPEPPARLPILEGTPEEQAVALAEAVGSDSPDPLAGWLTVYDAFGIPVFGSDDIPLGTTGDDPVGPPFWRVWYMSGMSASGFGFLLTDFVKVFAEPGDVSFNSQEFGTVLLEDLRAAAISDDPQVRLFGLFTAEVVKRRGAAVDLLDPGVTADHVVISGDLAELLSWVVIRGLVFSLAETETASLGARLRPAYQQGVSYRPQQEGIPCSEMWGNEEITKWANWVLSKLGGGIEIPFVGEVTSGIVDKVQEYLGTSESVREKTGKIASKVGTVAAALTLAMMLSSLELTTDADFVLERTKLASAHGKEGTIFFVLTMNPGKLPDGDNLIACVSSFLLNVLGISLSFPVDGVVPGAELVFEPGKGFGQVAFAECGGEAYVQFPEARQLRQDTDQFGQAALDVQGCRQKRNFPDEAPPYMREFSIYVSGQPEAVTGETIANIFFGGLSFGAAPSAQALINAILDIVKTFHWDLGEHTYRLRDWSTGWRVDGVYWSAYQLTGAICSGFDKPFTLHADGSRVTSIVGNFTLTPAGETSGTWTFNGALGGGLPVNGSGVFEMAGVAEEAPVIRMGVGLWTVTAPMLGTMPLGPGGEHLDFIETIILEPATDECLEQ